LSLDAIGDGDRPFAILETASRCRQEDQTMDEAEKTGTTDDDRMP